MTVNNNHQFPDPDESTKSGPEYGMKSGSDADLLSTKDVARRLGVCEKTAKNIMKELPHISLSNDIYSGKKRIRITEKTLLEFKYGIIDRKRMRRSR